MAFDVELIDGDLPHSTRHIRGRPLIGQRVYMRTITHKKEWILDRDAGFPYLDWTQWKAKPVAVSLFAKAEYEQIPNVARADIRGSFSPSSRRIYIEGTVYEQDNAEPVRISPFNILGGTSAAFKG